MWASSHQPIHCIYAPLVETRNFKFVCALMVILSLGGVWWKLFFTWVGTNCTGLERSSPTTINFWCRLPRTFSSTEDEISYSQILGDLEQRYSEVKEPLRICGLSLGALLAIDFAIRHEEKVDSLVLIGAQYKVPSLLIDFQNLIFRCMPNKVFESMGLSKAAP